MVKRNRAERETFETSIGRVEVCVEFDEHNEPCLTVSTLRDVKALPSASVDFSLNDGRLEFAGSHLVSKTEPIPEPVEKEWRLEDHFVFRSGGLPRPIIDEFTAIAEAWFRKHPKAFDREACRLYRMTVESAVRQLGETAESLRSVADDHEWEARGAFMLNKPGAARALRRTATLMRTLARQLEAEKKRLAPYQSAKAA